MVTVSVQWHSLPGTEGVELPWGDIRAVYETAGIALDIKQGASLARPVGDIFQPDATAAVLKELAPQAPEDAIHLLVGGRRTDRGALVSGELLDTDSRRLVIVYTQSTYISDNRNGLAQTCVHEIGHALDLTHSSVVGTDLSYYYHSAMEQSDDRLQASVPLSWECYANENAAKIEGGYNPLIFGAAAPQSGCLPIAWLARRQIQDRLADGTLLPGPGHSFCGHDVDDRLRARGSVTISPEHERYVEGGVLSLNIRVTIARSGCHRVPALIGPQYGNLAIKIRRPDGLTYLHRPRTLCCVDGIAASARNAHIGAAFCTLRGPHGAVFEQAGTYQVCAIAPDLGSRSTWVDIDVEPRPATSALASKSVRRALASGGTLPSRTRAALRSALENERSLEPHTRSYLALALSRGQRDQDGKQHLLRIAGHRNAPREIRLASLRTRIKRTLRDRGRSGRSAIVQMVERALPEAADDGTLKQIMEDVDYALQTT